MILVPLSAIPNQSLSIQIEKASYIIAVKTARSVTTVSITRNGVSIVKNQRAVSSFPLIPYKYLESGNFVFATLGFEYPQYKLFGKSQFLVYMTVAELAAARATGFRNIAVGGDPIRYNGSTITVVDNIHYVVSETGDFVVSETGDNLIG